MISDFSLATGLPLGRLFRPGQKVIYSKKSPIRQAEPESKGSSRLVGKRIALASESIKFAEIPVD